MDIVYLTTKLPRVLYNHYIMLKMNYMKIIVLNNNKLNYKKLKQYAKDKWKLSEIDKAFWYKMSKTNEIKIYVNFFISEVASKLFIY